MGCKRAGPPAVGARGTAGRMQDVAGGGPRHDRRARFRGADAPDDDAPDAARALLGGLRGHPRRRGVRVVGRVRRHLDPAVVPLPEPCLEGAHGERIARLTVGRGAVTYIASRCGTRMACGGSDGSCVVTRSTQRRRSRPELSAPRTRRLLTKPTTRRQRTPTPSSASTPTPTRRIRRLADADERGEAREDAAEAARS